MKKIFLTLFLLFVVFTVFSQVDITIPNYPQCVSEPQDGAVYKLFPTKNNWIFIKLNTRNGRLSLVQYSMDGDDSRFETGLCPIERVNSNEEVNGRFTLYPTVNRWTFIMLDQIDGRCWQVQWGVKLADCIVLPINP